MIEKQYEKTGIKEYTNKKEKAKKLEEKKLHRKEIEKAIERGLYKEDRKKCYDLSHMNYQKEYQKLKGLLEDYRSCLNRYDENTQTLLLGYQNYFDNYGKEMPPMGLRNLRKSILSTVSISMDMSRKEDEEEEVIPYIGRNASTRDEDILDFCITHHSDLQENDFNIVNIASLIIFLMDRGVPVDGEEDLKNVKIKAKSIHNELKDC